MLQLAQQLLPRVIIDTYSVVRVDQPETPTFLTLIDVGKSRTDKLEQQRGFLRPLGSRFGEFHDFQWRSLQDMLVQQRLINDKIDLLRAVAFDLVPDLYRQRGVSGL